MPIYDSTRQWRASWDRWRCVVVIATELDRAIVSRRPFHATHMAYRLWRAWCNYHATLGRTGCFESARLVGIVWRQVYASLGRSLAARSARSESADNATSR